MEKEKTDGELREISQESAETSIHKNFKMTNKWARQPDIEVEMDIVLSSMYHQLSDEIEALTGEIQFRQKMQATLLNKFVALMGITTRANGTLKFKEPKGNILCVPIPDALMEMTTEKGL